MISSVFLQDPVTFPQYPAGSSGRNHRSGNAPIGHAQTYPVSRTGSGKRKNFVLFLFFMVSFPSDFHINIISPSVQDKMGSGNMLTPNGQTIDDTFDDEEKKKLIFL